MSEFDGIFKNVNKEKLEDEERAPLQKWSVRVWFSDGRVEDRSVDAYSGDQAVGMVKESYEEILKNDKEYIEDIRTV